MSSQIHDVGSIVSFAPIPDGGRVVDEDGRYVGHLAGYGLLVTKRSSWVVETIVVPMVLSGGTLLAMTAEWQIAAPREVL